MSCICKEFQYCKSKNSCELDCSACWPIGDQIENKILLDMATFGSVFVKKLVDLYRVADKNNKYILFNAFRGIFNDYREQFK